MEEIEQVKKIEPVAGYIRVSHQESKLHGLSLDAQRMKLTEYAKNNNMKIVEWYCDEGVSGRKLIKNRPELQRMIQDAEKNKFSRCLFIKIDRFFRSVAEYHEAMKRMGHVLWTATEEEYDLSTANGRMLVNMKLTIAEMEADQTGERIKIVNEYKTATGQPLSGSQPFGWMISKDESTGRKKVVKDPDEAPILKDALEHFLTYHSKRKTITYVYSKYHLGISYNSFSNLLVNPMLYGAYRDNEQYCEAYIDKETFDKIQDILKRNVKDNTRKDRSYIFSGIIRCPQCGRLLAGGMMTCKNRYGTKYKYKKYRCPAHRENTVCKFSKAVGESTLEKLLLKNLDEYLKDAKIRATEIVDTNEPTVPKYDIDEINAEIERLNYSWKKGRIKGGIEQYDKEYDELLEQLELARAERQEASHKDFDKIDSVLQSGWQNIYRELDDNHKQAFWRSIIASIEIEWTTETKRITRVNFW